METAFQHFLSLIPYLKQHSFFIFTMIYICVIKKIDMGNIVTMVLFINSAKPIE
jgi:uncharacterized membrane protein